MQSQTTLPLRRNRVWAKHSVTASSPRAGFLWQSVWIFTWYKERSAQVECKLSLMSPGDRIDRRTSDLGANVKASGRYWCCIYSQCYCLWDAKNNKKCFTVCKVCMPSWFGTMLNSTILNTSWPWNQNFLFFSFLPQKARKHLYAIKVADCHVQTWVS